MWNEIKDNAKINLVKIHSNLGKDKTVLLDSSSRLVISGKATEDFYYGHPTPETLLKRWKCFIDLCIENELMWI